jgi:methyl-accepting chemotaxis protein
VTKEEFNNKVDEIHTTIGDVKTALEAADKALQDQIDDLKDSVDDLTDRVEDVEDAIDEITDKLEAIANTLKKMVTSIIIQGTDNPAFGSISLPTNMQTNMLIAYFGTAQNDVYFPTNRTGNYAFPADALTDKDVEMIGASDDPLFESGDYLVENEENNAGTLYVTINPNTVDYKGLQLSLENSQGKASGIKLGKVMPSKKTLGFGWTRAAGNGFYEIPAYVTADGISKVQKVDFNTDKIKDAVKEIINNRTNANFSAIAQDLYHVASNLNMDANAVKCEWTDGDNETHSVVSTYNLAATATKPLSFNSLKDINVVTVPGYERANALLDRLAGSLKNNIHAVFHTVGGTDIVKDIQAINIKKIEFKGLTDEQKADFKFTLDTDIQLDGLTYTFELTDEEVPIKFSTNVEVDMSDLTITTPTIVVNSNITSGGNSTLVVPLKNATETDVVPYHVTIPLDDLTITATAQPTVMNLDGLKKTININVNETAKISLSKVIDFSGKTVHVNKVIPLEDLADTFADLLEDQLDPVNDMLDQVKKVVDDVNIQLDKLNEYETRIDNKVDNYAEKVRDYLERANNKLAGLINSINSRFQPILLGGTEGVKILSQAKSNPSVIKNGTITFVPTTWNYELLVPVCKKHVAVTNVWKSSDMSVSAQDGDAGLKFALDGANSAEKMNKVLDGSARNIEFSGLISGNTYEIAYSALDFHGVISTKKFYITVVD